VAAASSDAQEEGTAGDTAAAGARAFSHGCDESRRMKVLSVTIVAMKIIAAFGIMNCYHCCHKPVFWMSHQSLKAG